MDQKPPKDSSARKPLPPFVRKSLESGLMMSGAVSENRSPETSCTESLNFDFDVIGSARVRKGTTLLGDAQSNRIYGLHYHVDTVTPDTYSQVLMATSTTVKYLVGGSWTTKRTGLTAGKTRFSTYLNYVFMVNGVEATAVWDGNPTNSFVTTGNAASAPIGKYIENFRSRMWIMGDPSYPARLYYSSVPSSVTTPVITWNTSVTTGQWIDISPSDGDSPTGLQRFRNSMLVFKTNRIYRVFDIGQVDPDPYYAVGTSSQESIIETKIGVYFHHSSGFYQYNVYGVVQEISRPIIDIIRAIPTSSYADIGGWLEVDGDHICWSIGTVTVLGVTYTNMVVRYTLSTQTWTMRTYPTQITTSIRRQPFYTDGTTQFAIVGDTSGNVLEMNTGKTDNGTTIPYALTHRWETGDGLLSTRKTIQVANFSHYGGAGTNVNVQTDADDPDALGDWSDGVGQLGQLIAINTGFNSVNVKARKWRFRISGESSGEPFVYNGYELLDVQPEFIQFPKQ